MSRNALGGTQSLVSIVVPCYNEEEVIAVTIDKLISVSEGFHNCRTEIICVDDGSQDDTLRILEELAEQHDCLRVLSFARNFGHQIAVTAGIDAADGDAVVLIDADLQDPPEVIPEMIAKWREGFDVVYGTRSERDGESAFKLKTARAFYRVLNGLSEVPIPLDTGDFRLMSRQVVDTLKSMPERDRFVRGMVSWVGFEQTAIEYRRAKRHAGTSKYPLRKMITFAADGIISFSTVPLRLAITLGVLFAFFAVLGILYALFMRIFTDNFVEGWTALMIAVLLIGGVQLVCLGILGEYTGKIYREVKRRPLYIVQKRIGFETRGATPRPVPALDRATAVGD
ncbi:glycosyltransferase family 2 protein [Psychromarinibacter sp. S121]|uniref:glycosyltransferase family 2 protein n=1 Tax=Psychromarinibacter sp. S121 TaxID=3415127 RepID=UPI003C7A0872